MFDWFLTFDTILFNFLNGWAAKHPWLDEFFIFSAKGLIFVIVIAALFFCRKKPRLMILTFLSAFVARGIFTPLLRFFFFRERPFVSETVNLLVSHDPNEASFPSGHAVFMFALSFAVFSHDKKIGAVFLGLSFLSAFSRVVVGVHYPLDIIGGIFVGFLAFKFSEWILGKFSVGS